MDTFWKYAAIAMFTALLSGVGTVMMMGRDVATHAEVRAMLTEAGVPEYMKERKYIQDTLLGGMEQCKTLAHEMETTKLQQGIMNTKLEILLNETRRR